MPDDLVLPIALRRTRRGRRESARITLEEPASALPSCLAPAVTPRTRGRPKKRVRFSDPGPSLASLSSPSAAATGLTPMVRRTSLSHPSPKQRRQSTPAAVGPGRGYGLDIPSSPLSGEMNFLPLRQVLDGRVKRRLRRNGLSEEMNSIHREKKKRAAETAAELGTLKAEVAAKDEEIRQLHEQQHDGETTQDTGRIMELERQVDELRRQLANRSGAAPATPSSERTHNWTMAARGPYADDYTMMDLSSDPPGADNEEEFGDTTLAELQCSTPTRRARNRGSFPTPPSTSPTRMPSTPSSHFSTPKSHFGVQVELPDPGREGLEEELASLQLEISKLTSSVESYQALATRLSDKLAPFRPQADASPLEVQASSTSPHPEIEGRLTELLRALADRTAAVLHLSSSLSDLGFPGADASEIITALSSAFRTARLELEYLTPGEITLPLTSAGAEVLDLVLTQLRDLARKGKEADDQIDEYHELELSLRKQLGARVEAMDGLVREVTRLEGEAKSKDDRISELEVGTQRLKGAVASYARDVGELEKLVERIEGELEGKSSEITTLLSGHGELGDKVKARDETIAHKDAAIAQLEGRLAVALRQTDGLRAELAAVQEQHAKVRGKHKDTLGSLNKGHGQALALRDARVSELRSEVDRVNEALRAAHETIRQLRVDNAGLSTRLDDEKTKSKAALDAMKTELERVVRMSQDFLATPKKAAGGRPSAEGMPATVLLPGQFLSGDLARRSSDGKSRKRRRYDSGLGFLDEEEFDVDT